MYIYKSGTYRYQKGSTKMSPARRFFKQCEINRQLFCVSQYCIDNHNTHTLLLIYTFFSCVSTLFTRTYIYMKYLKKHLGQHCDIRMFADDTMLYVYDTNMKSLERKLNTAMNLLDTWMSGNSMFLNTKKTFYMIFKNDARMT